MCPIHLKSHLSNFEVTQAIKIVNLTPISAFYVNNATFIWPIAAKNQICIILPSSDRYLHNLTMEWFCQFIHQAHKNNQFDSIHSYKSPQTLPLSFCAMFVGSFLGSGCGLFVDLPISIEVAELQSTDSSSQSSSNSSTQSKGMSGKNNKNKQDM